MGATNGEECSSWPCALWNFARFDSALSSMTMILLISHTPDKESLPRGKIKAPALQPSARSCNGARSVRVVWISPLDRCTTSSMRKLIFVRWLISTPESGGCLSGRQSRQERQTIASSKAATKVLR